MQRSLFRKAAIDKVSSPEQLDLLMQVTGPAGWLALATVAVLLGAVGLWSIWGSVPDLVEGQGVLLRGERLLEVQASMQGSLVQMTVTPGSELAAGQLIAVISRQDAGIESRRADEMAVERNEGLIRAKEQELATLQRQLRTQQALVKQGLLAANAVFEIETRINAAQAELNDLQNQTAQLLGRLESTAEVTAPEAGRVVEVLKGPGDSVTQGQALIRIEPSAGNDQPRFCQGDVHALLYLPARLAGKVRVGQPARVSPLDVKKEEYGFIIGTVGWIASHAASPEDMREKLKNDALVQTYTAGGPVSEARICLERDSANEINGFRWSSSRGPNRPIQSGGQCAASVVVATRRPYTYVIPSMRRTMGL